MDLGTGGEKLVRYYYDKAAGACSKFKYGGSGGNGNNFETKDDCLAACGPQPPGNLINIGCSVWNIYSLHSAVLQDTTWKMQKFMWNFDGYPLLCIM